MKNRLSRYLSEPQPIAPSHSLKAEPTSSDRFLTVSQRQAFDRLMSMAGLRGAQASYGGFTPRTRALLTGPTGVGKTAVVTQVAEALGTDGKPMPLLAINSGSWIVNGAKADPSTLGVVRSFVRRHERGIIFMDELDKVSAHGDEAWTDPWSIIVTSEVIALLDSQRLGTSGWSPEDVARLQDNFLIVGAGAWQRAHRQAQKDRKTHEEVLRSEPGIPEEISGRFNRQLIQVTPPTRDDFRGALKRLYSSLKVPASESLLDVVVDAALSAEVGMRFIEDHLSDLLLRYPELRQKPADRAARKPGKQVITKAAYDKELFDAYSLMEQAEIVVMLLRTQVGFHGPTLFPPVNLEDALLQGQPKRISLLGLMESCDSLIAGLRMRFARNKEQQQELHKVFWAEAHLVAYFAAGALREHPAYLRDNRLINLFTHVYLRVSKALQAFEYVCSLNPDETNL
jgi:hypothetical protein